MSASRSRAAARRRLSRSSRSSSIARHHAARGLPMSRQTSAPPQVNRFCWRIPLGTRSSCSSRSARPSVARNPSSRVPEYVCYSTRIRDWPGRRHDNGRIKTGRVVREVAAQLMRKNSGLCWIQPPARMSTPSRHVLEQHISPDNRRGDGQRSIPFLRDESLLSGGLWSRLQTLAPRNFHVRSPVYQGGA